MFYEAIPPLRKIIREKGHVVVAKDPDLKRGSDLKRCAHDSILEYGFHSDRHILKTSNTLDTRISVHVESGTSENKCGQSQGWVPAPPSSVVDFVHKKI